MDEFAPSKIGLVTLANGQLAIGNAGKGVAGYLTPGPGIAITNGPGSITIAGNLTAGPGIGLEKKLDQSIVISAKGSVSSRFKWFVVKTPNYSLEVNSGYIIENDTKVTLKLPKANAIGDEIKIIGQRGIWEILQMGPNQQISFGRIKTSAGAKGSICSTRATNCIHLICVKLPGSYTITTAIGSLIFN